MSVIVCLSSAGYDYNLLPWFGWAIPLNWFMLVVLCQSQPQFLGRKLDTRFHPVIHLRTGFTQQLTQIFDHEE